MASLICVDMSGTRGSLSLFERSESSENLRLIATQEILGELKHSEGFFDSLHKLVSENGLAAADIQEWWTNRGPGSFTGLRIGLSAIKGICAASKAKLVLIDGAEARAQSWIKERAITAPRTITVCTFSTVRKSICHQYQWDGSTLSEPQITFVETLPLSTLGTDVITDKEGSENYWPSHSTKLIFATHPETKIGAAAIASATPNYFATHEYSKAPVL